MCFEKERSGILCAALCNDISKLQSYWQWSLHSPIRAIQFNYFNSKQWMHRILLKSQYYITTAPTCFCHQTSGSLQLYKTVALPFVHIAAGKSSLCNIYVIDRSVHWKYKIWEKMLKNYLKFIKYCWLWQCTFFHAVASHISGLSVATTYDCIASDIER